MVWYSCYQTVVLERSCKCASAKSLVMGSWVDVTATVKWGYMKVYDGEGPVLYAKEIKPAKKPESELVYFN